MLACLFDHADGELARMTGRTTTFGHYYDLIADALVLTALFLGIGAGLSVGEAGERALHLGMLAGGATGLIVLLRLELERRAGRSATRQPNLLGFELQDLMYLVAPVTWLGGLEPFLILAAIGAPLYALLVLWTLGRHLQRTGIPQ
jgi:phosphatidylglycerophosphate synthase